MISPLLPLILKKPIKEAIDMDATVAELKNYLTTYADRFLKKDTNNKKMYQCPFCGSGSHGKASTGAFSIKENMFKCFSCGTTGDIFTLHAKLHGLNEKQDFVQIKKEICEIFGVKDNTVYASSKSSYSQNEEAATDYTEFFKECHARINDTDYLKRRGITNQKVIDRFMLGYAPNWKHPNATERVIPTDRLIIPVSKRTYTARNVKPTEQMNDVEKQYKKQKVGQGNWLFNTNALKDATSPIWIVEGELDAISIYEVGGEAVALGSLTNIKHFVEFVKKNRPSQLLILYLDNDEQGIAKEHELDILLRAENIPHIVIDKVWTKDYKDANDFLVKDRKEFEDHITLFKDRASGIVWNTSDTSEAIKALNEITQFHFTYNYYDVTTIKNTSFLTGWSEIDRYHITHMTGLYCLVGESGIGKSHFVQQIVYQAMMQSEKTIFISNNIQNQKEFCAYAIEKYFHLEDLANDRSFLLRPNRVPNVNSHQILRCAISADAYKHIKEAVEQLSPYIDNVKFKFAQTTTLHDIQSIIDPHSLVVIDDLSILGNTMDDYITAVKKLRSMALEMDCRVIIVCPMTYDEFRPLNFIVDVIWNLQGDNSYPKHTYHYLECCKNRYGINDYKFFFTYNREHKHFTDAL